MGTQPKVHIAADELGPLREAMRDIQVATSDYYAATARAEDLGRYVRNFLVGAQTLNEHLTNRIADAGAYKALFTSPSERGSALILALKYARNAQQHVLHIIKPSDDSSLVGGVMGMRHYAKWDEIPGHVHLGLRPGTRALKPLYDAELAEREVTNTMLAVLHFFASVSPELIHRDARGEWTGFPLMNQPGMGYPLHPEEPSEVAAARAWLDRRSPNGDARVVYGQQTRQGTSYVYGHTFLGRYSFAPFVETIAQVQNDISYGFTYLSGDSTGQLEDASRDFPQALQGVVLRSTSDLDSWASPFEDLGARGDWGPHGDSEDWRRVVRIENLAGVPDYVTYAVRRARRLNTFVPPSLG